MAAYRLSVLWRGQWKYRELIAPTCASALAAGLLFAVIAVVQKGRRNIGAIVRLTLLSTAICGVVATGAFFALLDNCSLSCGQMIKSQSDSPSGRWRAVLYSTNCVSVARYCPSVSHISVVSNTQTALDKGDVFTGPDLAVDMEWKSDQVLLIRGYWKNDRVARQVHSIGPVRIEYLPIGLL